MGIVVEDINGNLRRDPRERGVTGVFLSNGKEVAQTDAEGRYDLPAHDEKRFSRLLSFRVPLWLPRSSAGAEIL